MENEIYTQKTELPADLSSATDAELSTLSSALEIDLPFAFLREIGRSLIKNKTAPDEEILRFFSHLKSEATKYPENIALASLSAFNKEIADTLNDLYEKAKYIKASHGTPLTLTELIDVAPSYLSVIGAHAPTLLTKEGDTEMLTLTAKDMSTELSVDLSAPIPYGYVKDEEKKNPLTLVHTTELLLVSPCGPDGTEYSDICNKMLQDERIKKLCVTSKTVDRLGIIGVIAALPCGAYIELDKLSSANEDLSLCDLTDKFKGQTILLAAPACAEELTALVQEFGLCATSVAKVLEHPFVIIVSGARALNIEKQLIYKAIRMHSSVALTLKAESFGISNADSRLSFEIGDSTVESFDGLFSPSKKSLISALYTESLTFTDGISIALDTLFMLLARGADRRSTEFSFKIRAARKDLPKMVAAYLGIYRVLMEMCLPDAQSSLELTDNEALCNSLLCTAATKTDKAIDTIPDALTENSIGNKLYLLSFKRQKNTSPEFMPDFSAVRNTCDNLYTLIKDGNALSVRAFNSSIGASVKAMCGEALELCTDGAATINSDLVLQGFLVETSARTVLNLPLVGRIVERRIPEEAAEESISSERDTEEPTDPALN